MSKNIKVSLIAQLGVSIIIGYIGGYGQNFYMQILFTVVTVSLYLIFGNALVNQGSKLKNLLSLSLVSLISIVLTVGCIVSYQLQVVDKYNYAYEPFSYKIIHFLCFTYNASMVPLGGLIGDANKAFELPYGLIFTFFIPTAMMWIGLERRIKKDAKKEESLFKTLQEQGKKI